jgi:hypothetical protein
VQRVAAPRPSNAAIQALQAENKRLRRLLEFNKIDIHDGNPLSPEDGVGESSMTSPDGRIQAMQREAERRGEIGMLCLLYISFAIVGESVASLGY